MSVSNTDLQMAIRLILADELSKQLAEPISRLKELGATASDTATQVKSLNSTLAEGATAGGGGGGGGGYGGYISSYREMRMGAMAFAAAAQIAFSEVESASGTALKSHKDLQVAIEGSRVAMVGLMMLAMGLDPIFAAITVGATLAGVAVGQFMANSDEKAQALAQHLKELQKPFDDVITEVDKLNKPDPFDMLAKSTGDSAELLKMVATNSESAASAIDHLEVNEKGIATMEDTLNGLYAKRRDLIAGMNDLQAKFGKDTQDSSTDAGNQYSILEQQLTQVNGQIKAYSGYIADAQAAHQRLVDGVKQAVAAFINEKSALAELDPQVAKFKDSTDAQIFSVIALNGAVANAYGHWGDAAQTAAHENFQIADAIRSINSELEKSQNPINQWKEAWQNAQKAIDNIKSEAFSVLKDPKIFADPMQQITEKFKLDIQIDTDAKKVAQSLAETALKAMGEDKHGDMKPITVKIPIDPQLVTSDKTREDLQAQIQKIDQEIEKKQEQMSHDTKGKTWGLHNIELGDLVAQKKALEDSAAAMGDYATAAGKMFEKLEDVRAKGAGSAFASMVPPEVLKAGGKALDDYITEYEKAYSKITGTSTVQVHVTLFDAVKTAVDDTIKKFEDLQSAEKEVGQVLTDMAQKDPEKFQEFLKAENLAPSTTAADAAKTAFKDIAQGIDPAVQEASDYNKQIDAIKTSIKSEAEFLDTKAKAEVNAFQDFLDTFLKNYGNINVNINANVNAGNTGYNQNEPPAPPPPGNPYVNVTGYATGFVGMVGPGYGGPQVFAAGEGGEDELLAVIPSSLLSNDAPGNSAHHSGIRGAHRIIGGERGRHGGGSGSGKEVKDMTIQDAQVVNIYVKGRLAFFDDGRLVAAADVSNKALNVLNMGT